jgi:DNA-binding LytR/AlgR family response regulator
MNVLMIEQEKTMVETIKELLFEIDDSIHVVGVTGDMLSTAEWIRKNKIPDIILANKGMMSEIEKNGTREIKATVTFSTATAEYGFHAFRYKTIRHLFQPISDQSKLIVQGFKERFLVKQGQKLLSIPIGQIAYFFSEDRFIFFRTFDNQKFLSEYRIEELEQLLAPGNFFRVNRSFVVSLSTVKEIHAWFGNRLKLFLSPSAGIDVIVSRKRVNEFKAWLGK